MFVRWFVVTVGIVLLIETPASYSRAGVPDWTLMAEGSDYTYYVDRRSIIDIPGRVLQFRTMIDLMVPDILAGEASYSAVSEWLMDCDAQTMGLIRVINYKEHCGRGQKLAAETQPAPHLQPVVPQSAFSVALDRLCLPLPTSDDDIIDFARESWLADRPSGSCSH